MQLTNKRPLGFLFCQKKWYNRYGDYMLTVAKKVLEQINDAGYEAYIVGGFVRDYLLSIDSNDIDICTSATPKELKAIFPDSIVPKDDYGSVVVIHKNIRFEITTYRKEFSYKDNRHPDKVLYVDDLFQDLLRRDFTINSICMDKNGDIIDHLNGRRDLEEKRIVTIGDSDEKFSDDALRILRAVRFSTTLGFSMDQEIVEAIKRQKGLLSNLSYERKREELDKIFTSKNAKAGISLLIELGLDLALELPKLRDITYTDSLIAIWTILDVVDLYPFTANEKDLIADIKEAYLCQNLDAFNLYKYGLYVNSVAGEMKGQSTSAITKAYNELSISSRRDIAVSGEEIAQALGRQPGAYLKEIYEDLERAILYHQLENKKEDIIKYCISSYQE